jgi:hypothetical protein
MIFAMHQANYLPWLGYFAKLAACDTFVILDTVQYPRGQSFAARNRIKTAQGPKWLSMPVSLPKGHQRRVPYTDVRLADQQAPQKHLRTLQNAYARAPYSTAMFELYETAAVQPRHKRLLDLNIGLLEAVTSYLGLKTPIVRLSSLGEGFGRKSELIADIAHALNSSTYLSGDGGGRSYNDPEYLAAHGVQLRYLGFSHPSYRQQWGQFLPGMCVLDAIANCGPATADLLDSEPTSVREQEAAHARYG